MRRSSAPDAKDFVPQWIRSARQVVVHFALGQATEVDQIEQLAFLVECLELTFGYRHRRVTESSLVLEWQVTEKYPGPADREHYYR
jgi:hypothetical protein